MTLEQRSQMRQAFHKAWQSFLKKDSLTPLETCMVAIVSKHPEYHLRMQEPYDETLPEQGENPYLHLALHLGLVEQVHHDHPPGIQALYHQLMDQSPDPHQAEHAMISCLAPYMHALSQGQPFDSASYLQDLQALLEPQGKDA